MYQQHAEWLSPIPSDTNLRLEKSLKYSMLVLEVYENGLNNNAKTPSAQEIYHLV